VPTSKLSVEVIAAEAARRSNCLITTVRLYQNKDAFMIVYQPNIRATLDISGVLLRTSFVDKLVDHLAYFMKKTSDDILQYLNEIDEGVVEVESEDIKIEFSLGAEPPQSTI
jgi:hypothetical protein